MPKSNVGLGGSLFMHRKSKVHLLTQVATTLTCRTADHHSSDASPSDEALRLWLPRARTFRLSFQLHFADDVDLTPAVLHNIDSVVTDLVENAELWTQLGYQVSQTRSYKHGDSEAERISGVDFEVQSQPDFDAQSCCPVRSATWELDFVNFRLHFSNTGPSNEDQIGSTPVPRDAQEHIESQVNDAENCEAPGIQTQALSCQQSTTASSQPKERAGVKQRRARQPLLDEDVLCSLFDASFRSSICSKPIRLAASVKRLIDGDAQRLSDLAPETFVPHYVQRLQEYAQYIPGVTRQLLNFISISRYVPSQSLGNESQRPGSGHHATCRHNPHDIQEGLWNAVIHTLGNNDSVRKFRPLKRSGTTKVADTMLDFRDIFQQLQDQIGEAGQYLEHVSDQGSIDGAGKKYDMLDFCLNLDDQADIAPWNTIPTVAAKGVSSIFGVARGNQYDDRLRSDGETAKELYDYPFEQEQSRAPPQHERRKHTDSFSQLSDVSMLFALEAPMKVGQSTGQPQVIGGSGWLTQNVIRMHPLRQQYPETDGVDGQDSPGREHGLYEWPDLGWWSEKSDTSELPLEDYHLPLTTSSSDDDLFFPPSSDNGSRITDIEAILVDREKQALPGGRTIPMSTRQTQEHQSSSLADVIGSDHLLWHMWKRRASVAPRGEEDVTDMKTLFATDPDMKLFSSRWDLDPSDVSSGSNEDPMLQDSGFDQSPRNRVTSPVTPGSERRSYFAPTRSSSSSSGYVGRSSADPSRRSSLIKRFTWGGKRPASQPQTLDMSKLEQRTMEVKRRKTLGDYESMEKEASPDDSSDMLF